MAHRAFPPIPEDTGGAGTVQAKPLELGTQEARETTTKGRLGFQLWFTWTPIFPFSLQMTPFWGKELACLEGCLEAGQGQRGGVCEQKTPPPSSGAWVLWNSAQRACFLSCEGGGYGIGISDSLDSWWHILGGRGAKQGVSNFIECQNHPRSTQESTPLYYS